MKFENALVYGEEVTYDAAGLVATITTKIGSRAEAAKTDVKYDHDGRLVSIKVGDQDVWKFIYDKITAISPPSSKRLRSRREGERIFDF